MPKAKKVVFFTVISMCQLCTCIGSDCEKSAPLSFPDATDKERGVQLSTQCTPHSNAHASLHASPAMLDQSSNIKEAIEIITKIRNAVPNSDKFLVKLLSDPLGYTLIGEKPVSFEEYSLDEETVLALRKSFLHNKEFILHISSDGSDKKELCLIHKRSFFRQAQQEKIIASFLYEKKLSAQSFLDMFEQSTSSFQDFCDRDPTVVGTLLGFGSQNALFWARWAELGYFLRAWPFAHPCPIPSPLMITMP